jgi:histidinol phosphatase-like PHP family hydrolase
MSDGKLLGIELIRHFYSQRGKVIAITDHLSGTDVAHVTYGLQQECRLAERHWNVVAIPGVEITHVPPRAIRKVAVEAKKYGAELVIVHGETIVEPVAPETNIRALKCPEVDILAHPGLITPEEAELAAKNGIFIEISGRAGHCLANGHVVKIGTEKGVKFLICSDAHDSTDFLDTAMAKKIGRGAGMSRRAVDIALSKNPKLLLERIGRDVV